MAITTLSEAYKLKRTYGNKINETQPKTPERVEYDRLMKELQNRERKNKRNV